MANDTMRFRLLKLAAGATIIAAATALTSCAARPDRVTTSSVPDDYRTRHAITLAEVQHSLDVPIGSPVLRTRRVTTTRRNQPVEFATSVYRGDKYRFYTRMVRDQR